MGRIALLSFLWLTPIACKSDPAPPPPAPAAPAVPAVPATPPMVNPANPMQALAQMQALTGAMGNNPNANVLNWRELAPLLPDEVAGWKASGEVKGESNTIGTISSTDVHREYKRGALTARVKIIDTSATAILAAGFGMARMISSDGSDRYQKGIEVAGHPAIEEWKAGSKHGKVTLLVGGRFLVEANASGVPDAKPLLALLGGLDLSKLAGLK
ncbi:MAG: hypothetical protein EXR72_06560 [Myxococcales bacterium]|nr:hypothetical protein [Myxococcales bacterium]